MPSMNPKQWASMAPFDPREGVVIRRPPESKPGGWVGAPGVVFDSLDRCFYLVYRLRRPRGELADRGYEIQIARSEDGIEFETIWTARKEELGAASIERCSLARSAAGGWILYVSYVDPADGRWRTDQTRASAPDGFRLRDVRPVLTAAEIGAEGVKDPFVFELGGERYMIVSFARSAGAATASELHGSHDAYNTGLIRSATGLATSVDGALWRWEGEIFGPSADGWDRYCSRISCVWRRQGVWLALYDGSADVRENYEERVGLAYSFDLRSFRRVSVEAPLMTSPCASGALRYFDVLSFPEADYFYYEMAQEDGGHDLRVYRRSP